MSSPVYAPFEVVPCDEHGWACGGRVEPRYDLPVFSTVDAARTWMSQPANQHVHRRGNELVRLQWVEHTLEEAVALGFKPPPDVVH